MGMVAAAGVALATWSAAAAAAGGRSVVLAVLAAALVVAVWAAGTQWSTALLPEGRDVVALTAVTVAGVVVVYLAGWGDIAHRRELSLLMTAGVVVLAPLWPAPNVLRACLLLAAGSLIGVPAGPLPRGAIGGAVVGLAVGLVATNRVTAGAAPRLGGAPAATPRRLAGEALTVLAVVGLLAALAASLLPSPPGQGGGALGDSGRERLPQPAAPAVQFDDRLDVAGGRGSRGDGYVLLVRARNADVWRATTYDHWDGETWSRARDSRAPLDDQSVAPGVGDAPMEGNGPSQFQLITLLARTANVLPAAAVPTTAFTERGDVEQGPDATLYPTLVLTRGDRYEVFSDRTDASSAALRALGDVAPGSVPPDVADLYLQLPQVAPAVRALAADLAAGRSTTFDRVRALEQWIDDHTAVTDDATAVPAGVDPLEAFLLGDRRGPPERAATSMAVMLRALGIPARMAVGFLPGQRRGPDKPFVVRARDTSAWVEVWFPGVGWQRFDPSGRAPDPRAKQDSLWDRLLRFLRSLWPLLVVVALVAGAWLARKGLRRWRRRSALPWATRFFARMERAGAARGRPRQPQETPVEYAGELAAGVLPDPRLREVGELVTAAAWSRHEPPVEDRARAEAVLREATKAAPVRRLRRRPRWNPAHGPTIPRP